jgi:hypothetical protein
MVFETMTTPNPRFSPSCPKAGLTVLSLALLLFGVGCQAPDPPRLPQKGRAEFSSDYGPLNEGFEWAKAQALAYAFEGDPVGKWFEAALPGREAFCMRDVSHQALGAMALGLREHTKNMFRKFAVNISPSRDWASYWEINRYDEPAPVDYRSDEDFWYNLPANFDVIRSMYEVYEWTGDQDYLEDPDLLAFYQHSLTDYVAAWDQDGDGFMESPPENGIRGIPTYWEGDGPRAETGADLVAAQFAAGRAYGEILRLRGEREAAEPFEAAARRLQRIYNEEWWNPQAARFYTAILPDGSFDDSPLPLGQLYPLYFGIVEEGPRREAMVGRLPDGGMVELNAYFPEILYRNGEYDRAFGSLMAQLDPSLERRDYPEVSFTAVGHIVAFFMGVRPRASEAVLETKSRLTDRVRWAHVNHLYVLSNEISLRHDGRVWSHLWNESGGPLAWRAVFQGSHRTLMVNGEETAAESRRVPGEGEESWVEVEVGPGEVVVVGVGERS